MHICIISNSPTLRPCLPSSKKISKHRKTYKIFISSKAKFNVVVLFGYLKNERGSRLVGLKKGAFQVKGSKLACFTSRACLSSRELSLLSRVVNHSRVVNLPKFQKSQLFKFEQFSCFEDNFVHRYPN